MTPARNDPPLDYSNRSRPHLSPIKATPVKDKRAGKQGSADKSKDTRKHRHSDEFVVKSGDSAALPPSVGPMGATPLKKHSRRAHKRPYMDDSSPSPSDSGSDSDYGKRRTKKAKSGALRTYSERVKFTFRWPNEYVGRNDGSSPTYDQLTYSELVSGILVRQLPNSPINHSMEQQLRYYGEFFFEAPVNSFHNAKIAHRTVLEALEKGELISPRSRRLVQNRPEIITTIRVKINQTSPNPSNQLPATTGTQELVTTQPQSIRETMFPGFTYVLTVLRTTVTAKSTEIPLALIPSSHRQKNSKGPAKGQ